MKWRCEREPQTCSIEQLRVSAEPSCLSLASERERERERERDRERQSERERETE